MVQALTSDTSVVISNTCSHISSIQNSRNLTQPYHDIIPTSAAMSSTQLTTFNRFSDFPPKIRALIWEHTFDAVPVEVVDWDNHVYAQINEGVYTHVTSVDPKADRLFLAHFRVKSIGRYRDSRPRAGESTGLIGTVRGPHSPIWRVLPHSLVPTTPAMRLVRFISGPGRWVSTII